MSNFRGLVRGIKNVVIQYDPIEIKVREATSNDAWGAKTTLMAEIARATNDHKEYNKLFAMLWKRLKDDANVLHVQKAMILIEYLLRNGSDRFIRDVKDRIDTINNKKRYQARSSKIDDVERARQVRRKAAALISLISDEKRLHRERVTADRIKNVKNSAVSSDSFQTSRTPYAEGPQTHLPEEHLRSMKEMKTQKKDDAFAEDFEDDPFAAPKKKKPAADPFDDDPFESNSKPKPSADPFADDPFAKSAPKKAEPKSADPFGEGGGADDAFAAAAASRSSKPTKKKSKKKKKRSSKSNGSADPFNGNGADPFASSQQVPAAVFEEEPAEAPAASGESANDLSGLFAAVGETATQSTISQPHVSHHQKQASVDFLSGGGGGGEEPAPQGDAFSGFASEEPTAETTSSLSGIVNLDNIMEGKKQAPKSKKSMKQMQQLNVGIDVFGGGQPAPAPGPAPKMMGAPSRTADVFFDQKETALHDIFGSSAPAPAPQPQMQQPYGNPGYGHPSQQMMGRGYGMQQPMGGGYGMPQQQQYNPYMQQQAPMQQNYNPFMAPMPAAQPAPRPKPAPKQKQDDAFGGLAW
eukprot:CAMPEP_0197524992 /NCGR_PEP_ID=MMETSP1318-20131121/10547_1 /TAXON_ID=552666 /ORGANISM="Partenskyella glossopodia, Strain RCC365" /LENGTH=580 /DNA_ID=CAMNT_0043078121 /DNA_START=51 /DNA_END=1793 /DNA_ORIENTATION=-